MTFATDNRTKYLQIDTFTGVDARGFCYGSASCGPADSKVAAACRGVGRDRLDHRYDTIRLGSRPGGRRDRAGPAEAGSIAPGRPRPTAVLQLYATEAALARARADLSQLEDRSARLAREEAERPQADRDRPPLADRIAATGRGAAARPLRPWRAGPDRRDPRCHLPRRGDGGYRRPVPGDGPQRAARAWKPGSGRGSSTSSGQIWPFGERSPGRCARRRARRRRSASPPQSRSGDGRFPPFAGSRR